jgi:hypothetical protein
LDTASPPKGDDATARRPRTKKRCRAWQQSAVTDTKPLGLFQKSLKKEKKFDLFGPD